LSTGSAYGTEGKIYDEEHPIVEGEDILGVVEG
jgi:co-chaperonin GroES (HSP10)